MKSPQLLASGSVAINMTPMIDVIFLLIIFFLVSSHLAKQENTLQLDLPSAVSGIEDAANRESMVVNIKPGGGWVVGGVDIGEAELASMLRRRRMAASEPLRLKIRTDQSVPYQRIEPVLRAAAEVGIGDIVFSVYEASQTGRGG